MKAIHPVLAVLMLAPGLSGNLPVASAGTACVLASFEDSSPCTFLCFRGDVIHFTWLGGSRTFAYRVEASCGGASATCEVAGYYAVCEGSGRAVNGVGTCSVVVTTDPGASTGDARPAPSLPRPWLVAILRDQAPAQPDEGVLECGAKDGDKTPFGCVEHLDPGEPGTGDPIAQHFGNDVCTSVYWLLEQPDAQPAQNAYHFQFPGCAPTGCYLDATANGYQVSPDDPTRPAYGLGANPTCTYDDVCLVAEIGMGFLYGWNGTSIIECSPGTRSVSAHFPPTCGRSGQSVGSVTTAAVEPRIQPLFVPFGHCVAHQFDQTVLATLVVGPAGDSYSPPPYTKMSDPIQVCNSVKSPRKYAG